MSELLINDIKSNNSELKSYNEGMQIIEEMAEVLKNYTERNYIMASHVILECYAEELYSKNYRKQSDVINEFIKRAIDSGVCKDNGDGTERLFVSIENLRKIAREIKGDSDDL